MSKKFRKVDSYKKEVSIEKFIKNWFPKIYIDEAYQRFQVWSESSKYSFINSLYRGLVSNPIIIVNVEMCMSYAKDVAGNMEDYQYFKEIADKEFKYISIDGNNRSQTINAYYNKTLTKTVGDDESREFFEDIDLDLYIYMNPTKEDIHDLAIKTNEGDSWNAQESRNAINTPIAKFIRDNRKTLMGVFTDKVKITNLKRMKGDELLVKMLAYENYGKIKLSKDQLDEVYTDSNVKTTTFTKVLTTLKKMMAFHTADKKLHNSEFFNLYVTLSYFNKNNMKIKDLSSFYLDYHQASMLRRGSKKTYESENGKVVTWSGLNGNLGLDWDLKLETVLADIDMDKHITVQDEKRAFTTNQKVEIWKNSGGMVRVNNFENPVDGKVYKENETTNFIKVSLMDVLTSSYVVDHIIPHTEGGLTEVENGEITTREYNSWKNKKMYETV
jgi:hypothetical protein